MDHPLETLIDRIVANSARRGDLDNLPGAGKPLTDAHLGKDAVLNRIMTEHQAKPQAVVLNEQIRQSRARLQTLTDPDERKAEMKTLANTAEKQKRRRGNPGAFEDKTCLYFVMISGPITAFGMTVLSHGM